MLFMEIIAGYSDSYVTYKYKAQRYRFLRYLGHTITTRLQGLIITVSSTDVFVTVSRTPARATFDEAGQTERQLS
jgi:hypothetical protein